MTSGRQEEQGPIELTTDPEREAVMETGIYVRARTASGWQSVDIAELDRSSLLRWLRSRNENWSENVVLLLLGHERE